VRSSLLQPFSFFCFVLFGTISSLLILESLPKRKAWELPQKNKTRSFLNSDASSLPFLAVMVKRHERVNDRAAAAAGQRLTRTLVEKTQRLSRSPACRAHPRVPRPRLRTDGLQNDQSSNQSPSLHPPRDGVGHLYRRLMLLLFVFISLVFFSSMARGGYC
jgi:hypothetical protein